jgi:hypothetical protein
MPQVFTEGVKLFEGGYFNSNLKLLEVKKFGEDEVQLRYKVVK